MMRIEKPGGHGERCVAPGIGIETRSDLAGLFRSLL